MDAGRAGREARGAAAEADAEPPRRRARGPPARPRGKDATDREKTSREAAVFAKFASAARREEERAATDAARAANSAAAEALAEALGRRTPITSIAPSPRAAAGGATPAELAALDEAAMPARESISSAKPARAHGAWRRDRAPAARSVGSRASRRG